MYLKPVFFIAKTLELFLEHKFNASPAVLATWLFMLFLPPSLFATFSFDEA